MFDSKIASKPRTLSSSSDQRSLNKLVFDLDYFRTSCRNNSNNNAATKYTKEINRKWNNFNALTKPDQSSSFNINSDNKFVSTNNRLNFNFENNDYKTLANKQFSPMNKDALFFNKNPRFHSGLSFDLRNYNNGNNGSILSGSNINEEINSIGKGYSSHNKKTSIMDNINRLNDKSSNNVYHMNNNESNNKNLFKGGSLWQSTHQEITTPKI